MGPRAAGPRRRPDGVGRRADGCGQGAQSRPMCHVQCPMSVDHVPCPMSDERPCRLAAASAPSAVTRPMSSVPCQRSARFTASHETVRSGLGAGAARGPGPWAGAGVKCPMCQVQCPMSVDHDPCPTSEERPLSPGRCQCPVRGDPSHVERPMSAIGALYRESRDGPVGAGSGRGPRPGALGRSRSQVPAGRAGAARGLATGHYLSRGPGPRAAGPRRRPDGSREARGRLRPGRQAQSRPMCLVQ